MVDSRRIDTLLLFRVCLLRPESLTDLHARWLKRRGLLLASAIWGRVDTKLHFGVKTPKNPNFGTKMPNFQSSQYTRFNFER